MSGQHYQPNLVVIIGIQAVAIVYRQGMTHLSLSFKLQTEKKTIVFNQTIDYELIIPSSTALLKAWNLFETPIFMYALAR